MLCTCWETCTECMLTNDFALRKWAYYVAACVHECWQHLCKVARTSIYRFGAGLQKIKKHMLQQDLMKTLVLSEKSEAFQHICFETTALLRGCMTSVSAVNVVLSSASQVETLTLERRVSVAAWWIIIKNVDKHTSRDAAHHTTSLLLLNIDYYQQVVAQPRILFGKDQSMMAWVIDVVSSPTVSSVYSLVVENWYRAPVKIFSSLFREGMASSASFWMRHCQQV